jgi:phage repressor protein C with HTH and peptisase S24 domain
MTLWDVYLKGNDVDNGAMKNAETIRAENLRLLLEGTPTKKVKDLALRIDVDPSQLSRWLPGNKNQKVLSSKSAREIEHRLGLPENWLDQDHYSTNSNDILNTEMLSVSDISTISVYHPDDGVDDGEVEISALNVYVGAGNRIYTEQVREDRKFRYSLDWLDKYGLDPKRLFRFKVQGNSMEPAIMDGAWITVEIGVSKIKDGRPYLIRSGDAVAVKYLFKRPDGGVIIRSHNPSEPDVVVPLSEMEHVEVIGEVVESTSMWRKPIKP